MLIPVNVAPNDVQAVSPGTSCRDVESNIGKAIKKQIYIWLVVSTNLKNISQNGNLPQIGVKTKNI